MLMSFPWLFLISLLLFFLSFLLSWRVKKHKIIVITIVRLFIVALMLVFWFLPRGELQNIWLTEATIDLAVYALFVFLPVSIGTLLGVKERTLRQQIAVADFSLFSVVILIFNNFYATGMKTFSLTCALLFFWFSILLYLIQNQSLSCGKGLCLSLASTLIGILPFVLMGTGSRVFFLLPPAIVVITFSLKQLTPVYRDESHTS